MPPAPPAARRGGGAALAPLRAASAAHARATASPRRQLKESGPDALIELKARGTRETRGR